jgi:DNA repair exonuclease SbcCD nuclease subunit
MRRDFTFVHAADIHLDSPLTGLAARNPEFSAVVRGATRRAFANIVDLAIGEGAAFVIIAGDLYDGTWKDQATGQYAVAQLARLSRAGIRSFIAFGNHDAESRISRHLTAPPGVHIFDNRRCETKVLDDLGVAIHGRGYREAATTENLAASYCPPLAGLTNIAVLHTALEGHPPHAPYAPCTVGQLVAHGHDYWALGHVHERSVRWEHPFIVYPGNAQGRHVRETGAKGAMLVHVRDGAITSVDPRVCDDVRWARAEVDARPARDMGELLQGVGAALREALRDVADRPAAARVVLKARGPLRRRLLADADWFEGEVRAQAATLSETLWIEQVRIEAGEDTPWSGLPPELAAILAGAEADEDCARAIRAAVAPLMEKLPRDLDEAEPAPLLRAAREGDIAAIIASARAVVEARLGEGEG